MAWAINKRLEKERENRGDPMDIGSVNNGGGTSQPMSGDSGGWSNYGNQGVWSNYGSVENHGWSGSAEGWHQGDVNSIGKGGGKGKGFQGICYNCGEAGHSARFCPKAGGKGYGKVGKGYEKGGKGDGFKGGKANIGTSGPIGGGKVGGKGGFKGGGLGKGFQ